MSGSRITDQQVRLYMNHHQHHPQKLAAAKSGMSERTARRVEHEAGLPSQQPRRYWRSRPEPFADVWESEVVPLLRAAPKLKAIILLDAYPLWDSYGLSKTNLGAGNISEEARGRWYLNLYVI